MTDQETNQHAPTRLAKVRSFARRHPVATVLGVGGLGLFGGAELAVGALIGAGVAFTLGRPGTRELDDEARGLRERARTALDHTPRVLRERAKAVMDAARGRTVASPVEPAQRPIEATD